MSCNFVWHPIKSGIPLATSYPSKTAEVLSRAFGDFPIRLSRSDIQQLRGIRAALAIDGEDFWEKVIEAVEECGGISLEMVC